MGEARKHPRVPLRTLLGIVIPGLLKAWVLKASPCPHTQDNW